MRRTNIPIPEYLTENILVLISSVEMPCSTAVDGPEVGHLTAGIGELGTLSPRRGAIRIDISRWYRVPSNVLGWFGSEFLAVTEVSGIDTPVETGSSSAPVCRAAAEDVSDESKYCLNLLGVRACGLAKSPGVNGGRIVGV
ncbi:hypothetical protein SCUP234_11753 [Seiridium cupressi]